MADRFPLILNTSANQIQEIASGDSLDLTGTNIANAGIITAGNVTIGAATTDLIVNGDARVTGILTIGTSSLKLDGPNNLVNVGTALTLGHTQGLQFHTQNLHSAGFEVNQVNASGIITATGADINGDIDVDGHTNLDNVSVAGVSTFAGNADFSSGIDVTGNINATGTLGSHNITITSTTPTINFVDTNTNPDFRIVRGANGLFIQDTTNGNADRFQIKNDGTVTIPGNTDFGAGIDVTGNATVSGNLSVGGVLTYEDVTNIDSVGIITARTSIKLDADGSASSNFLSIGADDDLKIFHQSNVDKIESSANGFHIRQINNGDLHIHAGANTGSANNRLVARAGGKAELYYAGNLKLSTETGGINITGVCTATSFVGDGSNLTGITQTTINANADNRVITGSGTANTLNAESGLLYNGSVLSVTGSVTASSFGSLGDYSGLFGKIRIGADVYGNTIKTAGDNNFNIAANTSIAFNLGAASNGSDAGASVAVVVSTGFRPTTNNQKDLGATSYRWANVYAHNTNQSGATTYGVSTNSDAIIIQNSGGFKMCQGNGATTGTVNFDARTYDTNKARLHKWTSSSLGGGSYGNYSEAWYDGGNYRHITSHGSGFKFDHHLLPDVNNTYDLGSSGARWRNLYTNDLNLSNEGKSNDVDGTWGNYTIQEGESDLFLINNRSGKKYKFNLTEVS